MFASVHTSTFAVGHVQSRGTFDRLVARIGQAVAMRRQHQSLRALDDARLVDLGLTRADVQTELNRSVWNSPRNRQV